MSGALRSSTCRAAITRPSSSSWLVRRLLLPEQALEPREEAALLFFFLDLFFDEALARLEARQGLRRFFPIGLQDQRALQRVLGLVDAIAPRQGQRAQQVGLGVAGVLADDALDERGAFGLVGAD